MKDKNPIIVPHMRKELLEAYNQGRADERKKVKEVVKKLMDRDFIMKILKEDIFVDEIEKNKFVCIDGFREKIKEIFEKELTEEELKGERK